MDREEIRTLAAIYREGLGYQPPIGREEVRDFIASPLLAEYQALNGRYIALASALSTKDENGFEVPNESATPEALKACMEARKECEEVLFAMRADWIRRKAERIAGRPIDLSELRMWVRVNHTLLYVNAYERRDRKQKDDEQRNVAGYA